MTAVTAPPAADVPPRGAPLELGPDHAHHPSLLGPAHAHTSAHGPGRDQVQHLQPVNK